MLTALRAAGFRVAIVSNCTSESGEVIHTTLLAQAADAVVLSCDVGLAKPDPAIYLLACERIGVPDPSDCVFVGDGADTELRGAARLGMRVIQTTQFSRNDPMWPGERVSSLIGAAAPARRDRQIQRSTDTEVPRVRAGRSTR